MSPLPIGWRRGQRLGISTLGSVYRTCDRSSGRDLPFAVKEIQVTSPAVGVLSNSEAVGLNFSISIEILKKNHPS